jgi:hypothetical protein
MLEARAEEAKNILPGSNKSRRSRAEVTEQALREEKMVLLNRETGWCRGRRRRHTREFHLLASPDGAERRFVDDPRRDRRLDRVGRGILFVLDSSS